MWEVEDYVENTKNFVANKVFASVDKVSYQDSQTRKRTSFNEAALRAVTPMRTFCVL